MSWGYICINTLHKGGNDDDDDDDDDNDDDDNNNNNNNNNNLFIYDIYWTLCRHASVVLMHTETLACLRVKIYFKIPY